MEKLYKVQMNSKGAPDFSTAVEVADRPQGKWRVTDEDGWANGTHALICSECGEGYHLNIERVIGDWNFCPNCGCRMKGADDE